MSCSATTDSPAGTARFLQVGLPPARHRRLHQRPRPPQTQLLHHHQHRPLRHPPPGHGSGQPKSPATIGASVTRSDHVDYMTFSRDDRMVINKLAALLRVANTLDTPDTRHN